MKNNKTLLFSFLCICLYFFSCGNETNNSSKQPFADCQYGAPKPIFAKTFPNVKDHTFQLGQQQATEKVIFDNNINLELIQSGCEKPKQEFQFTIPTNTKSFTDGDWIAMSLDMFYFMGQMSESLKPFILWHNSLKSKENKIKLSLPIELESRFFVKIDKVSDENSGLLIMTLYQE